MIGIVALEVKSREVTIRSDQLDGEGAVQLLIHGENILQTAIDAGQDGDKVLHYPATKEEGSEVFTFPRGIYIGYDDEAQPDRRFMVDVNLMTINEALRVLRDINDTGLPES